MRASRAAMLENGSRCFLQKSARTFEKERGENPGSAGVWSQNPRGTPVLVFLTVLGLSKSSLFEHRRVFLACGAPPSGGIQSLANVLNRVFRIFSRQMWVCFPCLQLSEKALKNSRIREKWCCLRGVSEHLDAFSCAGAAKSCPAYSEYDTSQMATRGRAPFHSR